MSEEDLKIARKLFDRAKENFERDGYLALVLFAWAPGRPPTISLIEGNPRTILAGMCRRLRLSGYDRFALIVEGWIVMGEENLKDIQDWVGRMAEYPKAQACIQIIFVSPQESSRQKSADVVGDSGGFGYSKSEVSPSLGAKNSLCCYADEMGKTAGL